MNDSVMTVLTLPEIMRDLSLTSLKLEPFCSLVYEDILLISEKRRGGLMVCTLDSGS